MTKLRKQRRKKVYRYNVNRKRLRNKIFSKGNIGCKQIKDEWEERKSVKQNLLEMGLSHDPNFTLKPKSKPLSVSSSNNGDWLEENAKEEQPGRIINPSKSKVAEKLLKEAKAPRESKLRLPKSQVEWVTYLLDKYGADYKAMARDKKNYNQETWKQIRAKIKRFKSIPREYSEYLKASGKDMEVDDDVDDFDSDDD